MRPHLARTTLDVACPFRTSAILLRPTHGQQRILQFAVRAHRRLRGERDAVRGAVVYRIVELYAQPSAREVMTVTLEMVASLTQAGWIERVNIERDPAIGSTRRWEYRVTEGGIAIANSLPAPPSL